MCPIENIMLTTLKKTPLQEVKLHKKSINTSTKLIVIMLQILITIVESAV